MLSPSTRLSNSALIRACPAVTNVQVFSLPSHHRCQALKLPLFTSSVIGVPTGNQPKHVPYSSSQSIGLPGGAGPVMRPPLLLAILISTSAGLVRRC